MRFDRLIRHCFDSIRALRPPGQRASERCSGGGASNAVAAACGALQVDSRRVRVPLRSQLAEARSWSRPVRYSARSILYWRLFSRQRPHAPRKLRNKTG